MNSVVKEGNKLNPDALVVLFEFDTTPIIDVPTGNDVLYYTNTDVGNLTGITWAGNLYTPFPFEFGGIAKKGDSTAPARPTLKVSNINEVFYAAFLSLGNLSGCRVVRHRTFFKYTDTGSEPNPIAEYPIEEYTIVKKVKQDRYSIEYQLGSALDRPGLKLPKRLILRDKTLFNLHAPGVSRTRLRS